MELCCFNLKYDLVIKLIMVSVMVYISFTSFKIKLLSNWFRLEYEKTISK